MERLGRDRIEVLRKALDGIPPGGPRAACRSCRDAGSRARCRGCPEVLSYEGAYLGVMKEGLEEAFWAADGVRVTVAEMRLARKESAAQDARTRALRERLARQAAEAGGLLEELLGLPEGSAGAIPRLLSY